MKRVLLLAALASVLGSRYCTADLVISSPATTTTITFDATLVNSNNGAFMGAGFAPTPGAGQLDSDTWSIAGFNANVAFGGSSASNTDPARGPSTGGVSTGGIYGFDVDNNANTVDRALGVQPGGDDFTPGSITLRIRNGTGLLMDSWSVGYNIFSLNNEGQGGTFNLSYSTDGTNFTTVPALNFATQTTAGASPVLWTSVSRSTTVPVPVPSGGNFFLRWSGDDVAGGSGNRDEFALDNVAIMATAAVPEASAFLFGGLALCGVGFKMYGRKFWARKSA